MLTTYLTTGLYRDVHIPVIYMLIILVAAKETNLRPSLDEEERDVKERSIVHAEDNRGK